MSNTKHTPGPWISPETKTDKYIWASKNNTTIVVATVNNQISVDPKVSISKDESFANAKLIVAAPELLDEHEKEVDVLYRMGEILTLAINQNMSMVKVPLESLQELYKATSLMLKKKQAAIKKATE